MAIDATVAISRKLALSICLSLVAILGSVLSGPANAEPALWKVQGPHATVYLFGTIHILRPGVAWRSPKIDAAIKASDALWLEIPDSDDPAVMQPLVLKYGVDRAHPLSSKLDAATKAKLAALLMPLGLTPAQFEPLRPWMAGLALSVLPLTQGGYDIKSGAEQVITKEMRAAQKPVEGFETAEQQVRYLADMPPAAELDFLKSSLDDAQKAVPELDEMVAAWLSGDQSKLESILDDEMRQDYPDLYQLLIVNRNKRFADRIAALVQGQGQGQGQGLVFVAVGAGHLAGPDSVQADLAKLGIAAIRQ
jgi:uncharacterized protein YbaP (TraB family)